MEILQLYGSPSAWDKHGAYTGGGTCTLVYHLQASRGQRVLVPGAGTEDSVLVRKVLLIFPWSRSVSHSYLVPAVNSLKV